MKIIISVILIICGYFTNAQFPVISTVLQIYNYSTGDTFEYHKTIHAPQGNGSCNYEGYTLTIITSFTANNNAITYTSENYSEATSGCCDPGCGFSQYSSNKDSTVIIHPDSGIYYYLICQPGDNCMDSVFSNSSFNGHKQNRFYDNGFNFTDETYADSLGLVSMDDIAEAGEQETRQQLIYFHKASGEIWGQPQAIATAIAVLQPEICAAKIIPTPAAESFKLILSKLPPGNLDFILSDGKGAHVFSKTITNLQTDMSRNKLSSGFYFWEIISENQVIIRGKLLLN